MLYVNSPPVSALNPLRYGSHDRSKVTHITLGNVVVHDMDDRGGTAPGTKHVQPIHGLQCCLEEGREGGRGGGRRGGGREGEGWTVRLDLC